MVTEERGGGRGGEVQAGVRLNPKPKGNYMPYVIPFVVSFFIFDAQPTRSFFSDRCFFSVGVWFGEWKTSTMPCS